AVVVVAGDVGRQRLVGGRARRRDRHRVHHRGAVGHRDRGRGDGAALDGGGGRGHPDGDAVPLVAVAGRRQVERGAGLTGQRHVVLVPLVGVADRLAVVVVA